MLVAHNTIMAGIKGLVALAFSGSVGMTFLFLACALPEFNNWWPFFVIVFYILAPFPTIISRRFTDDMGSSSACKELCIFITTGIVISSFGLPVVLARAPLGQPVIQWGACGLVLTGNVVVFLTILGFFLAFDNDEVDYSMW
ncbi:leptin receptor gene-related protein-like isoform X2 [Tachypleus tridentatus]|uniref:leptin receptor gene-related protein-like isoform X2 n=1 Tax=Tachypleus tridentatus TaxID=6853 RepID=UPI003FD01CF1